MNLILLNIKKISYWVGFGKIWTGWINVYKVGFWIVWRGTY